MLERHPLADQADPDVTHLCPECGGTRPLCPVCLGAQFITTDRLSRWQAEHLREAQGK